MSEPQTRCPICGQSSHPPFRVPLMACVQSLRGALERVESERDAARMAVRTLLAINDACCAPWWERALGWLAHKSRALLGRDFGGAA